MSGHPLFGLKKRFKTACLIASGFLLLASRPTLGQPGSPGCQHWEDQSRLLHVYFRENYGRLNRRRADLVRETRTDQQEKIRREILDLQLAGAQIRARRASAEQFELRACSVVRRGAPLDEQTTRQVDSLRQEEQSAQAEVVRLERLGARSSAPNR